MREEIYCFLPCRKGSERVPKKNIKPFAGYRFGLLEIKLGQLLQCGKFDQIVLSSNDEEVLNYAASLKDSRICIHERTDELSSSKTSTDELIQHAYQLIPKGHILWTHVTSPFVNSNLYIDIVDSYLRSLCDGFDSLFTATELQAFLWQDGRPINYDRTVEKWPRTQTLKPVFEVNSGAFVASASLFKKHNDRIGLKPFVYSTNKFVGHDIDWEEDFRVAEVLLQSGAAHV